MPLLRIKPDQGEISQAPISAAKLLAGSPVSKTAHQFTNMAHNFHCGIWESDAGKWTLNYTEDEFCYIIDGSAIIEDEQGLKETVNKGDAFVIPAGFKGTWETLGQVQKYYAIYEAAQ
ncbi:cupin domain-containing protein [Simiduia sp. 21SJ11W-1]|uniref:cupin domain-containing protein n=1 Tax=Simiduia sp. 21SJ11W-1 TaxID=2909669 RepID=UPI0020A129F5|nr:cupin domain-containing protein [Simiduia sp. 21SJ11W-1]UTA46306.1 cupin domain-containing protein [Simiduia sp. 21SJ11W-1]